MVITAGTPKRDTQPATKVFAVVYAVISGMGKASHQRENQSTQVSKYDWLSHKSSGPMMSTSMWANRSSGDGKDPRGEQVCLNTLAFWHDTHALAHSLMSVFIHDHTNLSDTSRIDAFAPGCNKLCMEENNVFRKISGTKERNRPVLVLHTTFESKLGTRVFDNFSDVVLSCRSYCNCWSFVCSSTNRWYSTQESIYSTRHGVCMDVFTVFYKTDTWRE